MAAIIPPIQKTGTTGLVTIYTVPAGKKARIDLRACNIHASNDGYADVYLVDPNTAANANDGYRCRNFPVPFQQAGSAPDLEYGLPMVAGMALQVRASAAATVAFSLSGVEDDA